MNRKLIVLTLTLCLLLTAVFAVQAAPSRLVDEAGLLSGAEQAAIAGTLDEISARHGMDIVIVTVDSTDGKSPMEYADDFFDYGGYGSDGILLLVSMEDSDWWVSTTGYGITAVTDAGLSYMSDRFVPYLSDGDYAGSFDCFATLCDEFITQAKSGDPYDTHNLPKDPFRFGRSLVFALAIGLVVALIATAKMKNELKSVAQQAKADDYVTAGSLQITNSRDFHLYTHVSRVEKASSSSGSSTHTSSSGRSHGGGGGKF